MKEEDIYVALKAVKRPPPVPARSDLQPEKCKGCVYGSWTGVNQFCMFAECKKGKLK